MDIRPSFESVLGAFALAAVVTPPAAAAVPTRAVWLPWDTAEVPSGGVHARVEPRRALALPLDGLPAIPRGTVVSVPVDRASEPSSWTVDAVEQVDFDHVVVVVVPA